MNALERYAVRAIVQQARGLGVDVPREITAFLDCGGGGSWAARRWADLHPDAFYGCCDGDVVNGPAACTCWVPLFDVDQAPPQLPDRAEDITVRGSRCGDCAFRRDSAERADEWMERELFAAAHAGRPFWCHQGMRRPVAWRHPDGRRLDEFDTADWQPPMVGGIPYRADGRPGVLCAGWAQIALRGDRQAVAS